MNKEPTIESENQNTTIKDDLKRFRLLPSLIIPKKAYLSACENKKKSIQLSIKFAENTMAKEIFFEKEGEKSKFSNEKIRDIELELRSDMNVEIKKLKTELYETEEKIMIAKQDIESFELEYNCLKHIFTYLSRGENFIIQRS